MSSFELVFVWYTYTMSKTSAYGIVEHPSSERRADYLYRVSIKCVIKNDNGDVLVVKETGREGWDLPGGGMDHGEDIRAAIARELNEEVSLTGNFSYAVLMVEAPKYLVSHDFWQLRLIYAVRPENFVFSAGEDSDSIAFINVDDFKNSDKDTDHKIYHYATL
jgi:ADP-ribose pyrophosphatase YjhB (NUDIX family)